MVQRRKPKMSKFDFLQKQLDQLKDRNLFRQVKCINSAQGTLIKMEGRDTILFCSNNYLNLAGHPEIKQAVRNTVEKFGYGSAASRLISGSMAPHIELETKLAQFLQKQNALVFPAGYMANEAVIRTIPQKGDIVLLDKLDHASIVESAKAGQADFRTYRRGDYVRLEKFLANNKYNRKFIITESIFSMDGDTADLTKLVELKNRYNAILIVDEAHSFGCIGKTGAGLSEQQNLLDEIDIIVATMSKAFGCSGGVVAGAKSVIDFLINKAKPFIYTTAPSPVNCGAALAALEIIKAEPQRRARLKHNADYLRGRLKKLKLNTADSTSHIIPIIIGDNKKTLDVSVQLFEMGFFITAIRPPTVPAGSARLRISLQCEHSKEQIDALCNALEKILVCG